MKTLEFWMKTMHTHHEPEHSVIFDGQINTIKPGMQNVAQNVFPVHYTDLMKCNMGSKMRHVKHKFWMITNRTDGWFRVQQWSRSESPARNTVLLEAQVWRLLLTHPVVHPPCMLPHNFLLSVSGSICWDVSCSHQLVASIPRRLHCWPVIMLLV